MGWETNKDKKAAAKKFLEEVVKNENNLRADIVKSGNNNRQRAHDTFKKYINIPDDVEVICLEPSTPFLDKVVVFKLPEIGATATINPLKHWIAAWVPYGPGQAPPVSGK